MQSFQSKLMIGQKDHSPWCSACRGDTEVRAAVYDQRVYGGAAGISDLIAGGC